MEQQKPTKIMNVRISPELHEAVEDYRWRHRMTQSGAIRFLLKEALNQEREPIGMALVEHELINPEDLDHD